MLVGSDLIAKVKELNGASKSDIVRACGYVSVNKDGGERLAFTQFYEALLDAKGVDIGVKPGKGRKLSYKTKIQFNGKLQIGQGYLNKMGLEPGTEFDIKLGRNTITLSVAA